MNPRGCIIGPLVICAYACSESEEQLLRGRGVRDSKLLLPAKREKLAQELCSGAFELDAISAVEITERMRGKTSLNELEAMHASALLHKLNAKFKLDKAIVDSPDPTPAKFEVRLRKYFDHEFDILCANKADRDYPIVGAASILAKSEREKQLESIKKIIRGHGISQELGSGYTHDPLTIAFLQNHGSEEFLQEYIRHEWKTAKRFRKQGSTLSDFL